MLPSPAELKYFQEVASLLNLSRAAERLGISQPSLSLAMQRLEHTIGLPLFVRHKQGVTLTQAGKQLLLHSRQLLQYWENTKAGALASQAEVQGHFTLGCHSTIAIHTVTKFLPDLLEKYPNLQLHLKHDISRKITQEIISLSLDLGIVTNPVKHPDLIIQKLCEDEVRFWVGEGARKTQDIYSKEALILCDPELAQTQALLKQARKQGLVSERILPLDNLEVVASLTANGAGIGILPALVAESLWPDKLQMLPNMPIYRDEICLVFRHENRILQAIQTISAEIKEAVMSNLDKP